MSYLSFFLTGFLTLVTASTYTNPIRAQGADPHMVYFQGYYYLLNSQIDGHIQMARSTTLGGMINGETKNVWQDPTPSRCCAYWAPEQHQINGTWYIYYTASPQSADPFTSAHRPYVLQGGATPWDTYTYLGQLSPAWSIDGSIILFPIYGHYFIYSCLLSPTQPENPTTIYQNICIAPLTSVSTIGTSSIISSPTFDWEKHGAPINEGPHALYNNLSQVYITFSASGCGTQYYALGLLTWTGGDPTKEASWTKNPEPVLSSANGNYGTGHNGVFLSPDASEVWNVFHAEDQYPTGACNNSRYTMAERIYFAADGTPTFEQATRLGTVEQGPAGEEGGSPVEDPEPPQN